LHGISASTPGVRESLDQPRGYDDVRTCASSGATVTTILQFENPASGPPTDRAGTTFGALPLAGTGWTHFVFPVAPGSLTPIFGHVNTLLSRTTVVRVINASGPTEADTQLWSARR